jgi:hypothetical protein
MPINWGGSYGEMQERIARYVRRDGLTSDIKDSIIKAIKFYEGDRFHFNEGEASAITTAGTPQYTLPLDYREADTFKISRADGSSYVLKPVTYQELNELDINQNNSWGEPTIYATYRDQLRLYPIPDQGYTLTLSYQKDLQEVSASSSSAATNDWFTEGANLIESKAMAYLFRYRLRNFTAALTFDQEAQMERSRLKQKANRQMSTGFFRKTYF